MALVDSVWLDALAAVLIDVVALKATLLVAAVALLCLMLRGRAASLRAGIWSGFFLVLLVLPGLTLLAGQPEGLFGSSMPQPLAGAWSVAALGADGSPVGGVAGEAVTMGKATRGSGALVSARWITIRSSPALVLLVALWAVGAMVVWGGDLRAMRAARRLVSRCDPPHPRVRRELARLARSMGMARVPRSVSSPEVQIPSVFGRVRPVLLLPVGMEKWSREARDSALVHELAHLRRGDLLVHAVSRAVVALYWPNPLIRFAALRLHAEREQACDDGVVSRLGGALEYASVLVSLARATQGPVPALSFTDRSTLAERVRSLVDPARPRGSLGPWARGVLVGGGALMLVGALALDLVAVAPPDQDVAAELASSDPRVRQRAAWSMGEREDPAAVGALTGALSDPDARVRRTAAWALGEIKDEVAVEALARLLDDTEPLVREMAALAIGEIESERGLVHLEAGGAGPSMDEAVSWAAAQIRGQGFEEVFAGVLDGSVEAQVEPADLVGQLGAEDPEARAQAAEALGRLGWVPAVDALLEALDDADPVVRARAIWALDEINPSRTSPVTR